MARQSKAQRLAAIHALAIAQFQDSYDASQDEREQALLDRRFVNKRGAQWDWAEGKFDNKIMMEIDHVSGETIRIMNERDQNTVAAQFLPADGSDADELADAMASRYRADTQDAQGIEARSIAFRAALEGGMGGRRLRAEYENGEDGPQRICLEPINDAETSLYFDVNAQRRDKSDARHGFLIKPWGKRAFEAEYEGCATSWPEAMAGKYSYAWFGSAKDVIYVCEYFIKEKGEETFRVFNGFGDEIEEYLDDDLDDKTLERLSATGFTEIEPRVEKFDRVHKYIMSGAEILSDDGIIPGRNIPLIPQYGYWAIVNGEEMFRGHVRKARDPQIVYNMQVSKVAETAAASGIEKPIFTPEQMLGHAELWQNDHIDNNAFLTINAMTDASGNPMPAGPIAFTKSPDIAPAVAALIQLTKQDMVDQFGNQQATETMQPNTSGFAMELAQAKGDMRSAAFMTAEGDAERRTAEIWQDMASEIYVEKGRKLKTYTEAGKRGSVEIGKKIFDSKTGALKTEIDFARAKFDVVVDVGPTSASKRQSIVRTIIGMLPFITDPMQASKFVSYAVLNMESEGFSDLRDDARRTLITMGVVKPTKEEEAELAASQEPAAPDENAVLAAALAEESKAKGVKAIADTQLAAARTEQVKAETAKTLAEIPMNDRKQAFEEAKAIAEELTPNAGQPNAVE